MSIASIKAAARAGLEAINTFHPSNAEALRVTLLERRSSPRVVTPLRRHLDAAIDWLKRAQDAHDSGGVAWGYRARRPIASSLPTGWINPYPETTGYIIPTMLRYARLTGDADCVERARRMSEWEVSIQLPDGGIQGGIYGSTPVASSTFVTGQVLFGLIAAYAKFGDDRMRTAAIRAADWLLSCLDTTGRFVRGYSYFCAPGAKAYEVRTGAAIAALGDITGETKYIDAASKMADYALSMQQPSGWFAENDLNNHDQPLTHTIGYVMEGLEDIGTRLHRQDCTEAVRCTLDAIVAVIEDNGYLAGRLRSNWAAAVDWACLTGSSQIAGVFLRMYMQTGNVRYFEAGRRLLGFVCFTQDLRPGTPGLDGGIRGSYPFSGLYGQWCVLNWATKFFADSVMDYLEAEEVAERSSRTLVEGDTHGSATAKIHRRS
jgi:hypothetical protein